MEIGILSCYLVYIKNGSLNIFRDLSLSITCYKSAARARASARVRALARFWCKG